jgi:hypothetical protein
VVQVGGGDAKRNGDVLHSLDVVLCSEVDLDGSAGDDC